MLLVRALHSVKFVLSSVDFIFTEQLVLGTDGHCHDGQVLYYYTWSFRHKLALEDSVDADASRVTEGNGLGPRVALLEENVLEVSAYEGVLYGVAIVIKGLHHVVPPALAQL